MENFSEIVEKLVGALETLTEEDVGKRELARIREACRIYRETKDRDEKAFFRAQERIWMLV